MSKRSRAGKIIQVDFTDVETRELIPDGDYAIKVKEVTEEEGDKGKYLNWNMVVTTGEYKGKTLWYITSLTKQSLWNLRAVLEALGLEVPKGKMGLDLPSYKGLEMGVAVETEKYRGKTKNVVVDIYNLEEDREEGEGGGEEEDLDEMDLEELIEYAEKEEIELTKRQKKNKKSALAAIKEAEEEEEEEEVDLEEKSLEELVEYAEEKEIELTAKQKKSKSKALATIQEAEKEEEPTEEGGGEEDLDEMDLEELIAYAEKEEIELTRKQKKSKSKALVAIKEAEEE